MDRGEKEAEPGTVLTFKLQRQLTRWAAARDKPPSNNVPILRVLLPDRGGYIQLVQGQGCKHPVEGAPATAAEQVHSLQKLIWGGDSDPSDGWK